MLGDLSGVDPRAEQPLLRDALQAAAATGEDPAPLLTALVHLDPVACAELVAGPRALEEPAVVRAVLGLAGELEGVLTPSGLYRRLLALAPDLLVDIVQAAVERHHGAPWVWRLSHAEQPPGRTVLQHLVHQDPTTAYLQALEAGCRTAVEMAARAGDVSALRALYVAAPRASLTGALVAWLDEGLEGDVVAWLAAWHGPDVDRLLVDVARNLVSEPARRRLSALALDCVHTLEVLES